MKKISLLIMLLSVALMSLAGTKSEAPSRIDPNDVFGDNYIIFQRTNHGSAVNPLTHTHMVPQDGVLEVVTWDGDFMYYIKNIVYGADMEFGEYWVEGHGDQEGGFDVEMGQEVYISNRDGSFTTDQRKAILVWGTIHYEAATNVTSFTPATDVSSVHYSVDGNTIQIEGTSGPVAIEAQDDVSYDATGLGIVWEDEEGEAGEWTGYFEWGTELDNSPYVIDWQPEGELKTYKRSSDCIHFSDYTRSGRSADTYSTESLSDEGQIVFSNDGQTVYLKNPFLSKSYNTWVKGKLDGDQIVINAPQILYAYDNYHVRIYTGLCNVKTVTPYNVEPYDYLHTEYYYDYQEIVFSIEGNTITLQGSQADLNAAYPENFNARGIFAYDQNTDEGSIEANIVYTLKSDQPTVQTSAPDISGYASEDGQSHYVVIVPGEPSTIYYNVEYPDGTTSAWIEYVDVLSFTGEGTYAVNAYAVASDKLPSEQDHYQFTISPAPVTGISEASIGKEIVNRRYFNVMGQEIEQPEGMTIIVTNYSDGSTTAVKTMK